MMQLRLSHTPVLWVLLLCCSLCGNCLAAPRTRAQVIDIAAAHQPQCALKLTSRDTLASHIQPCIARQSAGWYAVNTSAGFVLVSADDAQPPVLGYSDAGQPFIYDSLPPAMRRWLDAYDDDWSRLQNNGTTLAAPVRSMPRAVAVPPILTSKWNQRDPYNLLAPCYSGTNRAAAGCVATAMAQIMYAYKYPAAGQGTYSYLWVSQNNPSLSATLSADFGNTDYRWDLMQDTYTSSASEESRQAVATLLYHCGVSVDMGYDCNAGHESGAVTSKVPAALASYFGYDTRYQSVRKDVYPADSLERIIYEELSLRHPVLVSGSNDEGGHAFVCDGYDGQGYFHFNWGWGGTSDGYFLLSALNPGTQGVGGTTKGYNKGTTFFIGLQPYNPSAKVQPQQLAADSITLSATSVGRSESLAVSAYRIQNYGLDDYNSGRIGVALYDDDGTQMVALLASASFSLKSNYYRTSAFVFSNVTVPAAVESGTYRLCVVYEDPAYGWLRMLNTMDDYYRTLYLSDSRIEFVDNHAPAELLLTGPIAFLSADSVPMTGEPLSFSIMNTGGTFRGDISARIYKGKFSRGQYEIMDSVTIRHGQLFSSALQQAFDGNLETGVTYKMKLCYRTGPSDSWHEFAPAECNEIMFTLYMPEEQDPDTPTDIGTLLQDGGRVVREQLLMRLPVGDLYMVAIERNQTIYCYKIIRTL